jgi:IS30 family transposase
VKLRVIQISVVIVTSKLRIAKQRHIDKPKNIKMTAELQQIITPLIKEKWSPDCISGRFFMESDEKFSNGAIK